MCIHLAACTEGIVRNIRVCIELGEELLYTSKPGGKHEGLVPVITRPEVSGFEELGHGHLRHFFSISKNPKFGLPHKDFLAAQQAGLPAFQGQAVIA